MIREIRDGSEPAAGPNLATSERMFATAFAVVPRTKPMKPLDITADGKTMWVTLRWIKKVAVIDLATRKITKMIPVGRSPHGVWTLDHAPRR